MTATVTALPTKRRILFYGGCHAVALHRIFTEFAVDRNVAFDHLVNFQLIGSGKPFPYETLGQYDAVVFNPIFNKATYNTDRLVEECRALGVKTVVYPWLQWNGYFPYIVNGPFFTISSWHYGKLPHFEGTPSLDTFQQEMRAALRDKGEIRANLDATTKRLRAQETEGKCDIVVTDFVREQYRKRRLFLTPDHPAKPFYDFFVREVSKRIDVPVAESFYWSSEEPQYGIRIPILPETAEALRLDFVDADYQNFMSDLGERYVHFDEYQRILYGVARKAMVYRSNRATFIKRGPGAADTLADADKLMVPSDTLIQIEPVATVNQHLQVRINWAGSRKQRIDVSRFAEGYLFMPHWYERPGVAKAMAA